MISVETPTRLGLFFGLCILGACSRETQPADGSASATVATSRTAEPPAAKAQTVKLEQIGLSIDVETDGEVTVVYDSLEIAGKTTNAAAALISTPRFALFVKPAPLDLMATAEAEAVKMERGHQATGIEKSPIADGWLLSYDLVNVDDHPHFVAIWRVVGGKPYSCMGATDTVAVRKAAIRACQSLRGAAP